MRSRLASCFERMIAIEMSHQSIIKKYCTDDFLEGCLYLPEAQSLRIDATMDRIASLCPWMVCFCMGFRWSVSLRLVKDIV